MALQILRILDRLSRQRSLRGVPRDLPPDLMRDVGLEPWPERDRLPPYTLW